jgi:hypothetical protein
MSWAENGAQRLREAINMWYGEVADYQYNQPGFSMNTGHFTQVGALQHFHTSVAVNTQLMHRFSVRTHLILSNPCWESMLFIFCACPWVGGMKYCICMLPVTSVVWRTAIWSALALAAQLDSFMAVSLFGCCCSLGKDSPAGLCRASLLRGAGRDCQLACRGPGGVSLHGVWKLVWLV